VGWTPTGTTRADWGTIGVVIAGTDVTLVDGVPTQIESYSLADPFGEETCVLRFPTVTGFESLPAWMTKFATVDLYHELDGTRQKWLWAGEIASLEWDGTATVAQCAGAMMGSLARRTHQPPPFRKGYKRDVGIRICRNLTGYTNRGFRIDPPLGIELGIYSDRRGSRSESRLDFTRFLLEQTTDGSGNQYTFLRDTTRRRLYNFVQRDVTTVDWTVSYGTPGVDVDLARDFTNETNRIFGEGVDARGRRWRNLRVPNLGPETAPPFPNDNDSPVAVGTSWDATDNPDSFRSLIYELRTDGHLTVEDIFDDNLIGDRLYDQSLVDAVKEVQREAGLTANGTLTVATWNAVWGDGEQAQNLGGARFDPLYALPGTQKFTYSANGSIIGLNPSWDPDLRVVDRFVTFGDGLSKKEARRLSRREVERLNKATYRGTIRLTADPQEGSRLDIQAGDNIRLKQFTSNNGVVLHVAGVQVSPMAEPPSVTLTVDNVGRMLPILLSEIDRDRGRRKDPVWAMSKSRTSATQDAIIPWDYEAGSGEIGPIDVEGGRWQVFRFVGAEAGIINRVRIETDPAREFGFAIFGKQVSPKWLQANIGNPLDESADSESPWTRPGLLDKLDDREFVEAWGWAGGGGGAVCGYGKRLKYNEDGGTRTLRGWFADEGQWSYFSWHGVWMWLAIYTSGDTEVTGRLRAQVTEGE
jgi:hypothetical protein